MSTRFDTHYQQELGKMASERLDTLILDAMFSDSPLYQAHKVGIHLPHPWNSPYHRQANLDYLTKRYPEFLI